MPKILLVDDDKDLRQSLALVLDHHGFEVTTAGNVAEALAFISSESLKCCSVIFICQAMKRFTLESRREAVPS
jgi:DNA-binding response OmpR family regulator